MSGIFVRRSIESCLALFIPGSAGDIKDIHAGNRKALGRYALEEDQQSIAVSDGNFSITVMRVEFIIPPCEHLPLLLFEFKTFLLQGALDEEGLRKLFFI